MNYGASLRASQFLILGAKARALMHNRYNVAVEDIQALAYPVFRHRILPNFHAESEGITSEEHHHAVAGDGSRAEIGN